MKPNIALVSCVVCCPISGLNYYISALNAYTQMQREWLSQALETFFIIDEDERKYYGVVILLTLISTTFTPFFSIEKWRTLWDTIIKNT